MSDEPRNPELESLFELMADVVMNRILTHLPGRIVSYDEDTQSCSVQPLIMYGHLDERGRRVVKPLPELHDAPVKFIGPKNGRITTPVKPGDLCTVMWCSASIATQKQVGGLVDPKTDHRHDVSDAYVLIGGHSFKNPPTSAPDDAVVWHVDDGTELRLGAPDADQSVIRGDAFRSALDTMLDAFALAESSLSPAVTAFKNTWATLLSGKVKIE